LSGAFDFGQMILDPGVALALLVSEAVVVRSLGNGRWLRLDDAKLLQIRHPNGAVVRCGRVAKQR
jgi:hypothetical protein